MFKKLISKFLIFALLALFSTQHVAIAGGMHTGESATLAASIQISQPAFKQAITYMIAQNIDSGPLKKNLQKSVPEQASHLNKIRNRISEKIADTCTRLKNFWFKLRSSAKLLQRGFITVPLAIIFIAASGNASAFNSVAFLIENDATHFFLRGPVKFSDEQYTSGAKLTFLTEPSSDSFSSWMEKLPFFNQEEALSFSDFSIGQLIYTPQATHSYDHQWDDRPYAGLTYLEWARNSFNEKAISSLIADVGLVGPWSMADQTQNKFHEMVGFDYTNGWEHQIGNKFLIIASLSHTMKILDITTGKGLDLDIFLHGGAGAGNWLTYVNIGTEMQFGINLDTRPFGNLSTRLDRGMIEAAPIDYEHRKHSKDFVESVYVFMGAQLHGIAYDVTIEGNGHNINREPFVGNFTGGIAAVLNVGNLGPIRIVAATTLRTERFKEQKGPHYFSSLMVNIPLSNPPKKVTAKLSAVDDKPLASRIAEHKGLGTFVVQQHSIEQSI